MKLFARNDKMRKTAAANKVLLYNFGIPAFQSETGLKTCPNAGLCAAGCYAKMGAYLFSNSARAYEARLKITFRPDAASILGAEIAKLEKTATRRGISLVVRVHDSGDFYSAHYQMMWYAVARAFPNVRFYAYTKQVVQSLALEMVRPANFELIFSMGGKQDKYISPLMRHSRVFESLGTLRAAGYIDATSNDLNAIGPNVKVGLVYHGTKSYQNTRWSSVGLT